jgi:hypothetical protein
MAAANGSGISDGGQLYHRRQSASAGEMAAAAAAGSASYQPK